MAAIILGQGGASQAGCGWIFNTMNLTLLFLILTSAAVAQAQPGYPSYPFAPAAGETGSTAFARDDAAFVGWATGHTNVHYGANLDEGWMTPELAYGAATNDNFHVVALGSGGEITMTFDAPITNGDGWDFAVFENGFVQTESSGTAFLELAWVEVSTDGLHFVRFPNYTFVPGAVDPFAGIFSEELYGFASKYVLGFGTPFDLQELQWAYDNRHSVTAPAFSDDYVMKLEMNFPMLDLTEINYVKLVDIVGDGTYFDAEGFPIYDPFPTIGSAGFDLEAVGVIHQKEVPDIPEPAAMAWLCAIAALCIVGRRQKIR